MSAARAGSSPAFGTILKKRNLSLYLVYSVNGRQYHRSRCGGLSTEKLQRPTWILNSSAHYPKALGTLKL